jgi:hypothetical protein
MITSYHVILLLWMKRRQGLMTCYAGSVLWTKTTGYFRPLFDRVRRHVREDPQLGTLTRDTKARCWIAPVDKGDRRLEVVIAGDDEPTPQLLAYARDLVSDFDALERRITDYLAREAEVEATSGDPALAAEIRALRISSFRLTSPADPGQVVIDFEGWNEMRFWRCDYVYGELSGLGFES